MKHIMKLQSQYFDYILKGTKRIELRLYDEKRQRINVGDTITFINESENNKSFDCRVIDLLRYDSFEELVNEFDISLLADKSIAKQELLEVLNSFYSKDKQLKYGVVGIKTELLMEDLDLYDSKKQVTGEIISREKGKRPTVPKGRYFMIVLVFMENSKGEFLIQLTSKEKGSIWATTGGHVKAGQTSKEAILDEIQEELGIDINPDEIELFKSYQYDFCFKEVFYIKKDIDISSLIYQKEEVDHCEYMSVDNIKKLIKENKFRKSNIDAFEDLLKK